MIHAVLCCLVASSFLLTCVQAQDGLVDERPVMPRVEYERLWQVDCAQIRKALRVSAMERDKEHARALLEPLQQCAFIDEALNAPSHHVTLRQHLVDWLAGNDRARAALLEVDEK